MLQYNMYIHAYSPWNVMDSMMPSLRCCLSVRVAFAASLKLRQQLPRARYTQEPTLMLVTMTESLLMQTDLKMRSVGNVAY